MYFDGEFHCKLTVKVTGILFMRFSCQEIIPEAHLTCERSLIHKSIGVIYLSCVKKYRSLYDK